MRSSPLAKLGPRWWPSSATSSTRSASWPARLCQWPAAIRGLEACYVFAPIILVVVGSACLIGYRLDAKRQGEIRNALEALDATDNNALAAEAVAAAPAE